MKSRMSKRTMVVSLSALCVVVIVITALYKGTSNRREETGEKAKVSANKFNSNGRTPRLIDVSAHTEKTNAKPQSSKEAKPPIIKSSNYSSAEGSQYKEIDMPEAKFTKLEIPSYAYKPKAVSRSNHKQENYSPAYYAFWRRNVTDLDNVYNEPKVTSIRNLYMEKYLEKSNSAIKQQDWKIRKIFRKVALKQLEKGIEPLESLYQKCEDLAIKIECLLAISELQYKSENYDEAIKFGKKVIDNTSKPRLASQAYYYLINSYAQAGDVDNSQKYISLLFRDFPDEAKVFYGEGTAESEDPSEFEAMLRNQAYFYEQAERISDLMLSDTKNADILRKHRNTFIEMAENCKDVFLKLDESIQQLNLDIETQD